jgi:cell division septation protein DedD
VLKGLLIGFAATVTIGLAMASWYVGVRIVAANEIAPITKPAAVSPIPAATPGTTEDSMADAFWYTVAPRSRELYLQVASLGPLADANFLRNLEAKGYTARVEANAKDDSRILIGPFSGRGSLEEAQRKLQSAGVLAIETAY